MEPRPENPKEVDDPSRDRAEVERLIEASLGPFALELLDRTPQPFVILDLRGAILRANRAFCTLLGYEPGELDGRPIVALTSEAWHAATIEVQAKLLDKGRSIRYEKEYRARDGRLVPVDLVADLLRDESGRPIAIYGFITDVTAQKDAEHALRHSEARFRRLFDEAPFGYHELDSEGRITAINRAECDLLGVSREEVLGRPIVEFIDPSERGEAARAVAEKLAGLRPLVPLERTYRRRDGRSLIVTIRERLRVDENGRIHGIRSTIQDITEQKRMEADLLTSQRRAQALFDGIEDAVFVHDTEGRILEANPAASRLLAYSREQLLGMTTAEIDAEDFAAGYQDRLRRQLVEGRLRFEGRHRAGDGRVIPVEISTSMIRLGEQTAVLAVIRDVTEHKALEETRRQFAEAQARNAETQAEANRMLRESEVRYRQLTEATLDAVVVADAEGRITLFNPAAERIFGFEGSEVVGRPMSLILVDPEVARLGADSCACVAPDARLVGRTAELRGRRKDGEEFPLELSLSVVGEGDAVQYIGSIRDLTERQRMRDVLVQTEKLASIGLLSAGVAHEINNPLAYVANNLAVLERDLGGILELVACYEGVREAMAGAAPEVLERALQIEEELDWEYVRGNVGRLLGKTREGVQRVASIVSNLRGMARTSPPKKELVPLVEVVATALEMSQGQFRKARVEAEVEVADNLARVPCVATQVTQVVLNLLINATQAIGKLDRPEGGRIVVRLVDEADAQALSVADDGAGIDPEDLPKLYDPFFTTKPIGEGTGLGLAISHGIVTGHGGTIEVHSVPGKGTTFTIRLPRGG